MAGVTYYAIGDIHGEAGRLATLHDAILDRIAAEGQPARIVHLGDYVDRGPDSRGVIDRIMALEAMFADNGKIEVISLLGNHEQMMLDAYDADPGDDGDWWSQGGLETADSYAGGPGLADATWRDSVPEHHITWMRRLRSLFQDTARKLAFVHAGIDPARFPLCPEQVRIWTRSERFFDQANWPAREELHDLLVIHGHTPKSFYPEALDHRINVDTGACFGGPLTAVVLKPGEEPEFIMVGYRQA